ncbi:MULTISPECIES: head-tail adaptor protein [unclassified Beijerinckia]|uniref:phage head completion protein n=1 Tax=unclassified Beijerinckia TaxID=2638183 RepID=UPI0008953A60|nr:MULTISPECIES: head-tail adaptor protein [unclassified Beijerinckia]MDH7795800.1 hypothetical protein [Beijerinckia sp. GAS462]SEC16930.1 Phage head-tail joining protein [Beijerinckia sp. 28-YEA-48]
MIRAGKLDRKIIIYRSGPEVLDAQGVPSFTDTTIATLRAQLLEQNWADQNTDAGVSGQWRATFRTRWHADIGLSDTVEYEGDRFEVIGINEIGRRNGLDIQVSGEKSP